MPAPSPSTRRQLTFPLPPGVEARLTAIDSHTCGQMTRVVVDGAPDLGTVTVREARDHLEREHDWVRRMIALEPRGQRSMFGVVLVPPADPECAVGAVFMDAERYPDMCGHAIIGTATTVLDLGLIELASGVADSEASFGIETPSGPVSVQARRAGSRVREVAFVNRPAYHLESVLIPATARAETPIEIAYGGQWYAFADAAAFGLAVRSERIAELVAASGDVRAAVAERLTCSDPATGRRPQVENVVWVDSPVGQEAHARNVAISPGGAYDRSPCGTATSARLSVLAAQGALTVGEPFVNESILGTVYRGRILEATEVAGHPAVIPEVAGTAWLTGRLDVWVDATDPLREGFLVGDRAD